MEFLPRTLLYYMLSHGYLYHALLRHTKKRRLVLAAFPFFVVMGLFPYIHGLLPDGSMAQKTVRAGRGRLATAGLCLPAGCPRQGSVLAEPATGTPALPPVGSSPLPGGAA